MRNNYVEIRLDDLTHNIDVIRARLKPETKFLAVVKANAYGHGMEAVANAALHHGVDYLAVAFAEEGERLRNIGVTAPILLLGATDEPHMDPVIDFHLMPAVFTEDMLTKLQRHAEEKNARCGFHFKIDTGMNRIGFKRTEAFEAALDRLARCPNLDFVGMFTHFAVSELPDKSFSHKQAARFMEFVQLARARGYRPMLHAANSGAALDMPEYQFDMVRGGIAMYGCHPAGGGAADIGLKPALSWKTEVTHVKDVAPGEGVSYGLHYIAEKPTRVATLPVGYGDGYKRCLSGKASVLLHGKRAPEIGTVCMDQMMVDVTDIPDVKPGDEAVLLGAQGDAVITADEMAEWAGTISYEILLSISDRVPRIYR